MRYYTRRERQRDCRKIVCDEIADKVRPTAVAVKTTVYIVVILLLRISITDMSSYAVSIIYYIRYKYNTALISYYTGR